MAAGGVGAVAGDVLFARYAFPPNELGYCGPADAGPVLRAAVSGGAPGSGDVRRGAGEFDGAWTYLELIAAAAGIADPLDARVVEAYWVGNELLDALDRDALKAELRQRFSAQLLPPARARWEAMPAARVGAHHSFHVFAVYPWVDLLDRPGGAALPVLESCRIRWGRVEGSDPADPARLLVRSRPLARERGGLGLGAPRTESVRWSVPGADRPDPPGAGELVACHWDWVCDRLTLAQAERLGAESARALRA